MGWDTNVEHISSGNLEIIEQTTGLYPEYHGVLGSKLFDWKTQKELNYSEELFKFNKDVVPLWTLNEINGGTSGCLMWPGSEFAYKNVTCSYTIRYQTGKSLYELANIAFEWLTNGKRPANLVMMYINQPDRAGHLHGFASNKYMEQLRKVDDMASYLHRLLTSQSMNIDIVHISDHGMTSVTKARIIDLEKAMPSKGNYRIYSSTPVLQIVPEEGKFNTVLKKLQEFANSNEHFAVYDTKTFPGRWHCNNSRIGPITVVANLGYAFQDVVTNIVEICGGNLTSANISDIGIHGYDNVYKEMDGIFLASGPSFGPAKIAGRVKIIDLFDLFCHILEIENIPKSNGSIEGITSVLFERNQLESIANAADEQQHREIYVATKAKIAEHNAKYEAGQVTYSMGINHFADLTEEERGRYLGCRVPESK
ncbi:unnamed protein product [Hermetia illucens]|uniref:Cathepsin propeptide inhibitor domain-containing protein n=1 Tax=Hermetia illucens TaxID=343691 RepID=A0A7R8Z043_HERIL|nr:unnamed protein product [Hermetia illucens]